MKLSLPRISIRSCLLALTAALMLPAPAARAIPMTFGGILSAANEVPPNNSTGAGSVTVVLDPTAETIQILASFFGLTANDTAAHIHCCGPGSPLGCRTGLLIFLAKGGLSQREFMHGRTRIHCRNVNWTNKGSFHLVV